MLYFKLSCVFAVTALVVLASGCSSGGPVREELPAVSPRQVIINEHEAMAAQKRQELKDRQESELQNVAAPLQAAEQEEIKKLREELDGEIQPQTEEAEATLSGEELAARLQELQDDYDTRLQDGTSQIRAANADTLEKATNEMTNRHATETTTLEAELTKELQDKLVMYDQQQSQIAADEAAKAKAEQEKLARREAPRAQPLQAPPVAPGQAPGTQAPVEPVASPSIPPVTEVGLRREGDAPLGQRRQYVNKYFRTGEALQEITPSEDMMNREHHEIIVTFWMEGTEKKAVPQFMLNRVPISSWQDLEKGLAEHRAMLIAQHHILYPKVILDQQREVPRSVVDDILSVCFKVGIKHISMGNKEPRMEQ